MAIMQSQQCQCCLCVVSIFSVLFGVIMTSTGVCLVLNYGIMEVDTRGLPPEWQNEEGKKIVGIILICSGIVAMGIGGAVSTLFYTVCSRTKPSSPSSMPAHAQGARGKGGAIPKTSGHQTPGRGSRAHGKRKVSKPPRYHSRLPPHPEAAELDGSRTSTQLSAAMASLKSNNAASNHTTSSSHPPVIRVNSRPVMDSVLPDRSKPKEVTVITNTSSSDGEPSLLSYTTTLQHAVPPAKPGEGSSVREYRPNPVLKRIDEDSASAKATPTLLSESEGCATPPPEIAERDNLMGQHNAAFDIVCEDVESDEDISEMALPSLSSNHLDAKTLDNDISKILK